MEDKTFKLEIGPKTLEVSTRNLARNANGSVLVKYGDTTVLATCVMSKKPLEKMDFFPLMVEYSERYYAAGKILGSRFIRREGRPTDEAILISRIIDRTVRPLFPANLKREVQIVITCLSWDGENDPATLGLFAASLGLLISDIPWNGPTAAVRLSKNEQIKLFPNYQEREEGIYDMIVAGVDSEKGILVNMIEGQAKEAPEQAIFEAFDFAKPQIKSLLDLQKTIQKEIGKEKIKITEREADKNFEDGVKGFLSGKVEQAMMASTDENGSEYSLSDLKNELKEFLKDQDQEKLNYGSEIFEKEVEKTFEDNILKNERRPDGRKLDQVRELSCEVGLLPRIHGCGLFSRGETSALSVLTLGAPGDQKLMDGMEVRGKKRFMHHYNFLPYCTGEVKPMRGTGRREVGHGMLGEKAILPMLPNVEDFPYTIRIVSEVLSSNGSSSMASTCAAS